MVQWVLILLWPYFQKNHNYYKLFKQLFAQVTNPPLDGIRERIVTDISLRLGNDFNIFDYLKYTKKLLIQNPVISNEDLIR